jgi:hypothetical protein
VPGHVLYAGYTTGFAGYGKVVVERSGKYVVVNAHLARVRVRARDGTHLHFEARRGKRTVNPMRLLG